MNVRRLRIILIITLIPEVIILAFFVCARILSPHGAGKPLAAAQGIPHVAVIAHRGASYLAPEETRPAYLLARDLGADYLEGDVQRTKDGVLVLSHDDTLERTTNVAQVFPGREKQTIDQFTFAELGKLDAGSWFNAKNPNRARDRFAGLKIITVDQLITIAESGFQLPGLYLETKSPERYPGVEKELISLLQKRGWIGAGHTCPDESVLPDGEGAKRAVRTACGRGRVILQSFSLDSIRKMRELAADVPRVYLVDEDMGKQQGWNAIVQDAVSADAGLGPVGYLAWPWYTGPAHRQKRLVHVYTIDAKWQLWLIGQFGADGFFTNRSEVALEMFGRIVRPDINQLMDELVF